MPTFTLASYAAEVDKLNRDLEKKAVAEITLKQAQTAKGIALSEARSDLGGDSRFSGWRGRDLADMKIKKLRGRSEGHILVPTRKSAGPWKVAEQGRNMGGAAGRGGVGIYHGPGLNRKSGETSYTKTGRVRRTTFKKKRWNGYTAGKNTASDARRKMESDLPKIAEKMAVKVTQRHFDVK